MLVKTEVPNSFFYITRITSQRESCREVTLLIREEAHWGIKSSIVTKLRYIYEKGDWMKSNIKYANILIIALAVAYFIIGGMNLGGYVDGKVILLCSIVSFAVAIVQILDVVISALQILKTRIIKISIGFLNAWGTENKDRSYDEKISKIEEYKNDQKNIHKKYENIIKKISLLANIILSIVLIVFILGLSTEFIKENTKIADTLSIFSFAFIFVSLTIQSYLDNYITCVNVEVERLFAIMEEKEDE